MSEQPKVRVDEHNCLCFRQDLTADEIEEFGQIARQAFNAGLLSGYNQGKAEAKEAA